MSEKCLNRCCDTPAASQSGSGTAAMTRCPDQEQVTNSKVNSCLSTSPLSNKFYRTILILCSFLLVLSPTSIAISLFPVSRHGPSCGRQHLTRTSKVVGGNETYQGEFPWTVSIRRFNHHHCGGVIIGQRWILTAAHCVQSRAPDNFVVRIGEHDLFNADGRAADHDVERIIIHGNYTQITGMKNPVSINNSDIALLRLKQDIKWSEYAWPVCLGVRESDSGSDAVVVGWGKKSEKSEVYSETLQKVKLTIVENEVCTRWYRLAGKEMTINDRIICAGFRSGGRDACHGDSGGKLINWD